MFIEICLVILLVITFSLCITFNNFKKECKEYKKLLRGPRKYISDRNPSTKDEAEELGYTWENTKTSDIFVATTKWSLVKKK